MKKAVVIIFFLVLGLIPISKAQAIIVRPVAAGVMRPVCPGPGYVWINPYRRWNRRMNTFVWVNGYWGRPRGGWHSRGRFSYRF